MTRPTTFARGLKRQAFSTLVVGGLRAGSPHGVLRVGPRYLPCVLGRSGRRVLKREGDGATPIGTWPIRRVLFRADRLGRPKTAAPLHRIARHDGWCDAPADPNYNRFVRHPYPASAEHLWREDDLYDIVVVLGHNDCPRRRGGGSAIFMHVARRDRKPTAGCVALPRSELVWLLGRLSQRTRLHVRP
jgi:L,D-peptidoglycan transpeptidase YkuD (ErfK/YbiS/YcfS/YnhG family)